MALAGATAAVCASAATPVAYATSAPTLSGQVLRDGHAVAGAVVTQWAWPVGKALESVPDGVRVPLLNVGSATTGVDGRYRMRSTLASLPASYRLADGAVNVDTRVVAGNRFTAYSTSTSATRPVTQTFDLGRSTVLDSAAVGPAIARHQHVITSRAVAQASAHPDSPATGSCGLVRLSDTWAIHQEVYGQANGWYYVYSWLDENVSHSNKVELATEWVGEGWSASGSASVEIGGTGAASTAMHGHSVSARNNLNTYKYEYICTYVGVQYYQVRPTSMAGLNAYKVTVAHPFYNAYCQNQESGEAQEAGKNVTTTTSWGMTVAGIHLGTSAVFQSDFHANYKWTGSGEFCGDSKYGVAQSPHVEGDDLIS